MYVHMTIPSGKDILVPQGSNIFSRPTSPKSPFSKLQVVSDSGWQDISKEPIKIKGLCKNASDLIISLTGVPYHKVHYT